jgi:signal peptidase II
VQISLLFATLGSVVLLDQCSKAMIVARLREGATALETFWGVRLRHVANRRYPWGSPRGVLEAVFTLLALVAAGALASSAVDVPWISIAAGASLGGATGNVIDGIRRRAVTDFIDLRVWPVFNLADAAIVGGAALAGWQLFQLV